MADTKLDPHVQSTTGPELPRVLGLFSIVSIVIGTMIGSGIFINPANVARDVGTPGLMLLVWVVGGALSFFGALAVAELAAAYPQAGGIYVYLREAYGSGIAFLFGWTLFLVVESGTIATLAVGFSTKYLPYFVTISTAQAKVVSVSLIAILAAVNVLGVRKGAFLMNFLTSIKFVGLIGVCVVVFIFASGSTANFVQGGAAPSGQGSLLGNFGVALVAALWAYKGWETSTYSAGELRKPERTLPLGLFIGSLSVIVLYILANLAYLYVFPVARMATSNRIAADVMEAAVGPIGASVIALIILSSMTGTANGHLLTSPRVFYAMAKDGLFFKGVAKVHPRYLTPWVSIIVLAAWASLLSLSGTFEQLFSFVIFGFWIFMGLTVLGVMILRHKRPDVPRPYRTWGYPLTPILFILSSIFLTVNSLIRAFWNSFIGLALIALGIPVYLVWKRRSQSREIIGLRGLWRYLRPHRWLVALTLLLAGIAQVLALVDPLIFGRIVDDYVLDPRGLAEADLVRGALFWLAVAVAVALAARAAATIQEYVLRLVVARAGMEMFNDGLKRTLRLSFVELEERSSGETMGLLQKVRTDTERFIDAAVSVLYSSLVGISFVLWYGVTRNWLLIPVFGIGVVVLGGLTGLLSQKIRTIQRSIVRETARLSGTITESLRNIELVKSLGLTWPEIRRLQDHTRRIFDLEMEKVRRIRGLSFLQGTIVNLLRQSILFILLWLIFRKALSTGELISFQLILATIFGPLQQLGRVVLSYRESEASLQAFDRLMETPIERRPEEPIEIGQIERLQFDDVVFRYRGAVENAIDHISFEARLGDTIAFTGPSGSGKSTLVRLLLGLYAPTSGVVSVDGVPIDELRYNRVRRQIGLVAQDPQLFSGTIRDNLQLVKPAATDEEMLDVLHRASAGPLLERAGQGLDTRLGEGGLRVSGGERQRLSIARALLREPRLFIFDEATSALDSITEREIAAAVREVSQSRQHIVILIAHRLSTIAHADTIYVLERGRIVETGSHEALVEAGRLSYAMWRQQVGERDVIPGGSS